VVVAVVVVGDVVWLDVTVVVGVVDSSLIAITSTLVIVASPTTVIPTLVIWAAIVSSVASGTSLYACAISSPATQASVMLVISSRRITPVAAIAVARVRRVNNSSCCVCGHDPAPKLTRMFCSRSSARAAGHTAVLAIWTESIKSVSTIAVREQLSTGRLRNPDGEQLKSMLYPNVYSSIMALSAMAVAGHALPWLASRSFEPSTAVHTTAATRVGLVSQSAMPSSSFRANESHRSSCGCPPLASNPR
jgi:hypothetical protein